MSYKNFKQLNSALSHTTENQVAVLFERLLRDARSLVSIPSKLASDWARSYAGVMVLKYDSEGNPTDVTDQVTANGADAPNSLVANVKSQWQTAKLAYDSDQSALSNYQWEQRSDLSLSKALSGVDLPSTAQSFHAVNWVSLQPDPNTTYFAGIWSSSGTYHIGIIPEDPTQYPRSPQGSELPVAYSSYSDNNRSMGYMDLAIRCKITSGSHEPVLTYSIHFGWLIEWSNKHVIYTLSVIDENGVSIVNGHFDHTYGADFSGRMLAAITAPSQFAGNPTGASNMLANHSEIGLTIKLGDIAFTDSSAISDISDAINALSVD